MLISKFKEIQSLRMTEVKSRPAAAEKMVVIGHLIVVRLKGGRWWCNWKGFNKFARLPSTWHGKAEGLLQALVMLELIPQSVADEHIAWVKQLDEDSDRRYAQKDLDNIAKKYGVAVPNLFPKIRKAG